jgi:DNA-binding transcriptional regulator YhcF (GntR family)
LKNMPATQAQSRVSAPLITKRQGEFLAFILRYTQKYGIAPSYEDMATHFGISSPSVNGMMKTLERNGFISRLPGVARTVRVEVRPDELPNSEFAPPARQRGAARTEKQVAEVQTAVPAAIAVLNTLMPTLLGAGATDDDVIKLVTKAAQGVGQALECLGVSHDEALLAARQVAAEVSRWRPGGQGVRVPRRTWQKR